MVKDENGFELVDFDHATGRSVWAYYDGSKTVYRTDYPVDHAIKENTEFRNSASSGWAGDYHRIASIPQNILWDSGMVEAMSQQDNAFMKRWLNDGDNAAWRTKDGTV